MVQFQVLFVQLAGRAILQQFVEEGKKFPLILHAVCEVGDFILEMHVPLSLDHLAHPQQAVTALHKLYLLQIFDGAVGGGRGCSVHCHYLVETHLHAFCHVGVSLLLWPHLFLELQFLDVHRVEIYLQFQQVFEPVLVDKLLLSF